jgi:DNA-binding MarR family transcriptional regulator
MTDFDLENFLPFRLHLASEAISKSFRTVYQNEYGMTRSEWRVLAHLGQYGSLTATQIGQMAELHKTKVSRAVYALERRFWLARETDPADRRIQQIKLTRQGDIAFRRLGTLALAHNEAIKKQMGAQEFDLALNLISKLGAQPPPNSRK